jgi:hypothetical protein
MRCCKALRAATTPQQAVNRSWADVRVIGKFRHCENTLRSDGAAHLNDVLYLRGSRLPRGAAEGDQGVAAALVGNCNGIEQWSRTLRIRVRGPDLHQLNLNRISRGGVDGLALHDVVSWYGRSGTCAGGQIGGGVRMRRYRAFRRKYRVGDGANVIGIDLDRNSHANGLREGGTRDFLRSSWNLRSTQQSGKSVALGSIGANFRTTPSPVVI